MSVAIPHYFSLALKIAHPLNLNESQSSAWSAGLSSPNLQNFPSNPKKIRTLLGIGGLGAQTWVVYFGWNGSSQSQTDTVLQTVGGFIEIDPGGVLFEIL